MKENSYFGKVCIAASFLLMLSLSGGIPVLAQTLTVPETISVHIRNKNIIAAMAEIAARSNLNFHYDKATIDTRKKVTLHCHNLPIKKVLDLLTAQTGFRFFLKDDKVIVNIPRTANTEVR